MTFGLGGRRRVGSSAPAWLCVSAALILLGAAALAQGTVATVEQLRTVAALGGTYTLTAATFEVFEPIEVARDLTLLGQGDGATAVLVGAGPAALRVVSGARLHLEGIAVSRLANESPSSDLIQVLDGHVELVDARLAWAKSGGEDPMKRFGLGSALYVAGTSTAVLTDVSATGTATSGGVVIHNVGDLAAIRQRSAHQRPITQLGLFSRPPRAVFDPRTRQAIGAELDCGGVAHYLGLIRP